MWNNKAMKRRKAVPLLTELTQEGTCNILEITKAANLKKIR